MELEKKKPETERQLSHVLIHKWFLIIKNGKTCLQITIPENLDINEDPKRGIYGSNLRGK